MAASGVTGPDICARETHLRMALSAVARAGAVVEEAFPELDQTYRTLRAMPWASDRGCSPDAVQRHFKATLAQNIRQGRELTIDAVVDAQLGKSAISDRMVGFLSQFDVLACPAVGLMPGPVEGEYPRPAA
ncbi:hypothetical protein [Nioella nitratireducens]|uniref:hypothetical protein n=1 Tax=Nioella nitratireducens TaxID=1287720 RepID=UPI0008FD5CB5|nr:hypothetical protein [Nioella nitratireducens]